MITDMIGKRVLVRGRYSGVFFGTLAEQKGNKVRLLNCRRLCYWEGAASTSQVVKEGVKFPEQCKFTLTLDEVTTYDAIEVQLCTDKAAKTIEEVRPWRV